jgi:hypothetical protein
MDTDRTAGRRRHSKGPKHDEDRLDDYEVSRPDEPAHLMRYSVKVRQPSFIIFFHLENCFNVLGNGPMLMCALPLCLMVSYPATRSAARLAFFPVR